MIGVTTIENMMQGVSSSLEDSSGGTSQMRLFLFLWSLVLCGGVAYLTYKNSAFPQIPDNIMYITGSLILGKVGQKVVELKGQQPGNTPAGGA
jgi:hypothetical protein